MNRCHESGPLMVAMISSIMMGRCPSIMMHVVMIMMLSIMTIMGNSTPLIYEACPCDAGLISKTIHGYRYCPNTFKIKQLPWEVTLDY